MNADSQPMAAILPDNPRSQLAFFQARAEHWASDPSSLGLGAAEAAAVVDATIAAAQAMAAAERARSAARAATMAWRLAAKRMREVGGAAIGTIKAYAESLWDEGGGPDVYPAAKLPTPGKPGPKRRGPDEANAAVPRIRNVTALPDVRDRVCNLLHTEPLTLHRRPPEQRPVSSQKTLTHAGPDFGVKTTGVFHARSQIILTLVLTTCPLDVG